MSPWVYSTVICISVAVEVDLSMYCEIHIAIKTESMRYKSSMHTRLQFISNMVYTILLNLPDGIR